VSSLTILTDPDDNFGLDASGQLAFDTTGLLVFDALDGEGNIYRVVIANDHNVLEDENLSNCNFLFAITPRYVFFRDSYSNLVTSTDMISAWALEEGDLREIFNHLALYNNYFTSVVAPVFLLVFAVMLSTQTVIMFAAVWLFGHWVKLSGTMSIKERFFVCTFASVPAGIISFAVGLFMPVIHVFVAQLLMIYFSYRAMKEYFNE